MRQFRSPSMLTMLITIFFWMTVIPAFIACPLPASQSESSTIHPNKKMKLSSQAVDNRTKGLIRIVLRRQFANQLLIAKEVPVKHGRREIWTLVFKRYRVQNPRYCYRTEFDAASKRTVVATPEKATEIFAALDRVRHQMPLLYYDELLDQLQKMKSDSGTRRMDIDLGPRGNWLPHMKEMLIQQGSGAGRVLTEEEAAQFKTILEQDRFSLPDRTQPFVNDTRPPPPQPAKLPTTMTHALEPHSDSMVQNEVMNVTLRRQFLNTGVRQTGELLAKDGPHQIWTLALGNMITLGGFRTRFDDVTHAWVHAGMAATRRVHITNSGGLVLGTFKATPAAKRRILKALDTEVPYQIPLLYYDQLLEKVKDMEHILGVSEMDLDLTLDGKWLPLMKDMLIRGGRGDACSVNKEEAEQYREILNQPRFTPVHRSGVIPSVPTQEPPGIASSGSVQSPPFDVEVPGLTGKLPNISDAHFDDWLAGQLKEEIHRLGQSGNK
ncbi:hypothetical protein F5890DRAFT_1283252 [Lentinula detonsa]|uniref:Uncharacterized protein n=1 Tax=Lentinula detonsa TaxID=2804962 RepID=A0AA38PZT9_9AGAR|nr:hypothetical protein F5890DRAFT_1283252 [Lentinula detonsa]